MCRWWLSGKKFAAVVAVKSLIIKKNPRNILPSLCENNKLISDQERDEIAAICRLLVCDFSPNDDT